MRGIWQRLLNVLAAVTTWRFFKPAVFVACLIPPVLVAWRLYAFFSGANPDALGVDPNKTVLHQTGQNTLALLFITLGVTPARRLLKLNGLQKVRRMLGVWTFTYAVFHLSSYLVFEQLCYSWATCQLGDIGADLVKRKFIIAGMTAFTILTLLAITSTSGWVRRLRKNWQRLHRLVYVAAVAGIVHFLWIQKSDFREPLQWALWLAVLFALRVGFTIQKRRAHLQKPVTA
jgi:sulfoxide reductase heme-binding subunit YedZ